MSNERNTEILTRNHFNKYSNQIIIEEQQSNNPKIAKLLKTASKSGNGSGYPEFIIQLNNNSDLIIVIECKANPNKHESLNRGNPKDFAVDGVLLYSSYLSKDYDVLSIAISGETEKELKISHFLQLKGDKKAIDATEKYGNKLLTIDDYVDGYIKSPEKFRQDYNKLLDFSKVLNEKLQGYKVGEKYRSLLVSCILIALENDSFKITYNKIDYSKPEKISKFLVDIVQNEFDKSIEQLEKGKRLKQKDKYNLVIEKFAFIKLDTALSTEYSKNRPNIPVLTDLIEEIEINIQDFIKTHEYFDVLGQLYIEFLRYANSDKGLGIVLTPPHVTDFMAELGEVNKDSIVFDNCTGTGGFLVSAMNRMVLDAKGDFTKINNIKQKQLIGIEYDADIFTLACSNMFIHQDGKSNILKGSCFDENLIEEVKSIKPNVGLLNPPYKSKKTDINEFEFVLNNLECLEQGGKCVCIIPMALGQSQKGDTLEWKKRILKNHTLEAVFSMPDELFINSDVATITSIMVFTSGRPHPSGKKTYFGYYKEDGFVKRKMKGRIDLFNSWNTIKQEWINNYQNKENVPGLSVNRLIKPEDEWCAEAYMETNYSQLNDENFIKKIINYSTYLFSNRLIANASDSSIHTNKLRLSMENWEYHDLVKLFKIGSTRDDLITKLSVGGHTPYITSSESNNGVTNLVDEDSDYGENTITANRGGSVGYFFYQPYNYLATPVDVRTLSPLFPLNKYIGLFLCTVLELEKYRYNYSRKMGTDRLKQFRIKLPTTPEGKPDWQFMEDYIKSLPYSSSIV